MYSLPPGGSASSDSEDVQRFLPRGSPARDAAAAGAAARIMGCCPKQAELVPRLLEVTQCMCISEFSVVRRAQCKEMADLLHQHGASARHMCRDLIHAGSLWFALPAWCCTCAHRIAQEIPDRHVPALVGLQVCMVLHRPWNPGFQQHRCFRNKGLITSAFLSCEYLDTCAPLGLHLH